MSLLINNREYNSIHFTGILGSGMSAIAQYLRWDGLKVSGSDRLLASEDTALNRDKLTGMGCNLFNQDGTGINESTEVICISTAIEDTNPEILAAKKFNIPILHRSDVLAAIVSSKKTIAVAGTSGKSTVTAMIFEFLSYCGKAPSLISGAALKRLEKNGFIGNAFHGTSDLLVIEADESDGTLIKYHPYISVILNVSKDHKPIPELMELFRTLKDHTTLPIVNNDDPLLRTLDTEQSFGILSDATWKADKYILDKLSGTLLVNKRAYTLNLPGIHNLSNLAAALSVCKLTNCDESKLAEAVPTYEGVARRFTIYTTLNDIVIVDDFAHNPEKIKAAVNAARNLSSTLIAIYQPHGFGPTRFLRDDYVETFKSIFKKGDTLFLLPIYYAGGTAQKDISSQMLIDAMGEFEFSAMAPSNREELLIQLQPVLSKGICILSMGARDPSLGNFALSIKKHIESLNL
ncbi:MAG: UDP-N-acetylmuramate--L-alanine ligase [Fibrobacterota bacterium]|nr:Mur ligase domain-containing protein [Chitinispirillaceae bacterium]